MLGPGRNGSILRVTQSLPMFLLITMFSSILQHVPFQYPLKTSGLLTFSGGIEMDHAAEYWKAA